MKCILGEICTGRHSVICSECWAKYFSSGHAHPAPPIVLATRLIIDIKDFKSELNHCRTQPEETCKLGCLLCEPETPGLTPTLSL